VSIDEFPTDIQQMGNKRPRVALFDLAFLLAMGVHRQGARACQPQTDDQNG
jgi:hypothetical protein